MIYKIKIIQSPAISGINPVKKNRRLIFYLLPNPHHFRIKRIAQAIS